PVPDDERDRLVDPDAVMAKALAEAGNDVLPADFSFDRPRGSPTHYAAVLQEVAGNLELTLETLNERLLAAHAAPATEDEFETAMREAAINRLTPLFEDTKGDQGVPKPPPT